MDDIMLTTVDSIKQTSPNTVGKLSDETVKQLIQDASMQVLADGFPETITVHGKTAYIQELATRYLTLHTATLTDTATGQGVTVEKVDVIEKHYADKTNLDWWQSSPWGRLYWHLWQEFSSGGTQHYAVVQH